MRSLILLGLLASACSFDTSANHFATDGDPGIVDASVIDADPADASVTDADLDASVADADPADASVTDADPADASVTDASVADADPADASIADADPPDADPPDADPPDADPPDATPCPDWPLVPSLFDPCNDIPYEIIDLVLDEPGTYIYDTGTGNLVSPGAVVTTPAQVAIGGATAIVVGRFEVEVGTRLRAIGSRPLMIVSWGDILISGALDVSSNPLDTLNRGAGGNSSLCNAALDGTTQQDGGGGGGGGGFGGTGGTGGAGRDGNNAGGAGGALASSLTLRGGCPGGAGGIGDDDTFGNGLGGIGGGAIFLNARTSLTIEGIITAGGMGGRPGFDNRAGGGGGGSGGLIGLESNVIVLDTLASLTANGGGGGGGSNRDGEGVVGQSGLPTDDAAAGGAGFDGGDGGDGGAGGPAGSDDGDVGSDGGRGGGGGGAAVGFIKIVSPNLTDDSDVISPDPTGLTLSL